MAAVSIPQAVSTVATLIQLRYCVRIQVSIPQAVSTVATAENVTSLEEGVVGFNTASGKYCCNLFDTDAFAERINRFNTASGKYCCN